MILLVKSRLRLFIQLHFILRHTCHNRAQKPGPLTQKVTSPCTTTSQPVNFLPPSRQNWLAYNLCFGVMYLLQCQQAARP